MHILKKRIKQGEVVELLESFNRKICVLYFFSVMCVYGEDWKKRMLVSMGKVEGETFMLVPEH